ncbi:MAG TPA: PEGA domain-containing protein [Terracidiphilus sp.]
MKRPIGLAMAAFLAICLAVSFPTIGAAHDAIYGKVRIKGQTGIDKHSGVFVDRQYVGFVDELKGSKKLLLLPGEHEIEVRHAGYVTVKQIVMVEPGREFTVYARMFKSLHDPDFPKSTAARVKMDVKPQRAAVFVDGAYMGTPHEFHSHRLALAPGKHQIRIALSGYHDFTTDVNLQPKQKFTIKTDLTPGSGPGPALGSE